MEEGININLLASIRDKFELGEQDLRTYSPLVLAYVGDAIYEIVIRTILVSEANEAVEKLHKKATKLVKAAAQKDMILAVYDELTEDEMYVYKRARNSKQHTTPKNADIGDYHKATGFEAVMGYLYLKNDIDRMLELIKKGVDVVRNDDK